MIPVGLKTIILREFEQVVTVYSAELTRADWIILAKRSTPLSIGPLHARHDALPLLEYSTFHPLADMLGLA